MVREASRAWIATAVVLLLAAAASAEPPVRRITTPSLVPDPNGFLYCVAVAVGRKPINMVTSLVTTGGDDVTDFRSSLRASPEATGDGRYHAEDRAGTLSDAASYCEVVVEDVKARDVNVILTSYAEDETVLDAVPKQ